MTIIAHENATANTPQDQGPHPKYKRDPYNYRPDGTRAPSFPANLDRTYRDTTSDEEIFAEVDAQPIGAKGTEGYTIAQAANFTRNRKAPGVASMSAAHVLALQPFRVYRALAEAQGTTNGITSPYVQLLDLVLAKSERTDEVLALAQDLDAAFPVEQMTLGYESKAEQILRDLDKKDAEEGVEAWEDPAETDPAEVDLVYTGPEAQADPDDDADQDMGDIIDDWATILDLTGEDLVEHLSRTANRDAIAMIGYASTAAA